MQPTPHSILLSQNWFQIQHCQAKTRAIECQNCEANENELANGLKNSQIVIQVNAVTKKTSKLLKPDTWRNPKSIEVLIIVGILVPIVIGLAISFGNYLIEAYLRSLIISVNYQPITVVEAENLDNFAQTNGFDPFERNLDDNISDNYFVVPIILKNSTRNPIEKASFSVDLGCSTAKLIDVKYKIKSPKSRTISIHNTLPKLSWMFPSNQQFSLGIQGLNSLSSENYSIGSEAVRSKVFVSLIKDRGFGMVLNHERTDSRDAIVRFVTSRKPSCLYFFTRSEEPSGKVQDDEVTLLPNPAYQVRSFKSVEDGTNDQFSHFAPSQNDLLEFLNGHATISFESGFPSRSEIELFVLGKVLPHQQIKPSIKLYGTPGVNIQEENLPHQISLPDLAWPDMAKRAIMPMLVDAQTVSDGVILCWYTSDLPNYAGVRLYKSAERPIGDFSNLGDEIFEGYGDTNVFQIIFPPVEIRYPDSDIQSNESDAFIDKPPPWPKSSTVAISNPLPAPPGDLRIAAVIDPQQTRNYKGFTFFHDKIPFRETNYTYTLYVIDKSWHTSYPVIVNVNYNQIATNYIFHLL